MSKGSRPRGNGEKFRLNFDNIDFKVRKGGQAKGVQVHKNRKADSKKDNWGDEGQIPGDNWG